MKTVTFVGSLIAAASLLACSHAETELGDQLGCTLAGNNCDQSVPGPQGLTGQVGAVGPTGPAGSACSATTVAAGPVAPNGGAQITCTDGTGALLLNGAPGAAAAPTPYTIMQVIVPCPGLPGTNKEILLRFANGNVLSSVSKTSGGVETRLSLLEPNTYTTTDGRMCGFNFTGSSVSWAAGGAGSVSW